ncbi:MAG: hypothetical protein HFP77_02485 [Methylococcales symbiont of Iophon sp. n. MRB-2018]|nr:MAG: hypothetical protein HFP77_02485 [Methylococcales symbiont of Iophon sp. n. MRB-2018]KAF3980379.1 MAG: hypothetical protein HFP76_02350 [Methylococcales symbiont of Iophon sp. n. MRB-2018]
MLQSSSFTTKPTTMPRIPRGETQGGIYHIINRGNMRMQVFDDEEDYEYFLTLLKTGLERGNIELHAYCLMCQVSPRCTMIF